MALSTNNKTLLEILDKMGAVQGLANYQTLGGTRMFARVDATGDEDLELYLSQAAHDADDELGRESEIGILNISDMPYTATLLNRINGYLATLGYSSISNWLTTIGCRVNYQSKLVMRSRGSLVAANVGGYADGGSTMPGTLLGSLTRGGSLVAGTDMDTTLCSGSPIALRVTQIGSSDWTVTVTGKLVTTGTKAIQQVILGSGNGGAAGDVYILGQQAVSSESAAGQKVLSVAATAQFTAAQQVLITEFTGDAPDEVWVSQEIATIASIQNNTSLTMVENLKHTYSASAFVRPLFKGVSVATGTGGTASDGVSFYPAPDRRLRK